MAGLQDKRNGKRYRIQAPIIFRRMTGFDYHQGQKVNHSDGGLAFTCNTSLHPGSIVLIRHSGCPDDCVRGEACFSCRSVALATVRWCNSNTPSKDHSFSVGAKFFDYGIGY